MKLHFESKKANEVLKSVTKRMKDPVTKQMKKYFRYIFRLLIVIFRKTIAFPKENFTNWLKLGKVGKFEVRNSHWFSVSFGVLKMSFLLIGRATLNGR